MGSILVEADTFDANIIVPVPGEYVRAGGGTQTPEDITGNGGNINGTVTYTGLVTNVRIRHIAPTANLPLVSSVLGNDVTVQLATNNAGVVTSTANAVVASVLAAAAGLLDAVARGTGAGIAGVKDWVQISAGTEGSVLPSEQSLTNRSRFLKNRVQDLTVYTTYRPLHWDIEMLTGVGNTIDRFTVPSFYGFDATVETFFSGLSPFSLSVAILEGGGAFANDTWYYVYLNTTGGAPIDVINTTVPMTRQNFQNGNSNRRYIGAFRTDSAANIKLFRKIGRRTVYLEAVTEYLNDPVGLVGAPNSYPIRYAQHVGVQTARLRLIISNSDTTTQTFFWAHDTFAGSFFNVPIPPQSTIVQEVTVASTAITPSITPVAYASAANKITVTVQTMEFFE